ncbi:uncharacterized protein LOC143851363 [Tasmannia lanceolata]|uniref:uncharacterized protein LOC143851363 n=1 Tax=Tasmannia lanceolata TaxID=3420 RepID=UPI004064A2DD
MDVAEQKPDIDNSIAISGDEEEEFEQEDQDEELEDLEEEEQFEQEDEEFEEEEDQEQQQQQQKEEESEPGMDFVDSAGDDIKRPARDSSSGKIFVGGVAWDTTEDTFTKHFKKYGVITDSVIMRDKHTRMPRGFGFVTFADSSAVEKVLEDEHIIDGRTVEVKRTVPREDMAAKVGPKTKKIFVGGIPSSLTEDKFKEYFSSYGTVVEHQIMVDHSTGRSRGFGFLTFESEDTVEEIISKGKTHELGGKQVEVKKAEPKRAGGDHGSNGRGGYGGGNSYGGFGGGGGGGFGYSGYRAGGGGGRGYGGRMDGGYGGYSGGPAGAFGGYGRYGYGAEFGGGFGGSMYDGDGYGGPVGGYGAAYGGYGGSRGRGASGAASSRYHPYGRY